MIQILKQILKKLKLYDLAVKLYDFIILLKILYNFTKLLFKNNTNKFFFFPFYHTGGAEWVHAKIVEVINGNSVTFFTHTSANTHFKNDFEKYSTCFELKPFLIRSKFRKIIEKIIVWKINSTKNAVVFGCHSIYFYELLPKFKSSVKKIDLIHAFTLPHEPGAEKYSLPYVSFMDKRVCINTKAKNDLIKFYHQNKIDCSFAERIQVIENCPTFECETYPNKPDEVFNIVYVGRNSPEKRVHLIGKIASELKKIDANYQVILVGENLVNGVEKENQKDCVFLGGVYEVEKLKYIYKNAHVVIITSFREGFPLCIMEGMICGAVPITTNVGGISQHVIHGVTGYLVDNELIEVDIISDFVNKIVLTKSLYNTISYSTFEYAKTKFSEKLFIKSYNNLFNEFN
jgi:glycosyltransferase involved in cell wall biosynthesis